MASSLASAIRKGRCLPRFACCVDTALSRSEARRWTTSYVDLSNAPPSFDAASVAVYPGFIDLSESKSLVKEASKRMKRRRFEDGHWDSVITGYREVELPTPDEEHRPITDRGQDDGDLPLYAGVIQKTRKHLESHHFNDPANATTEIRWLPAHAIDLSADGELTAHVDSVKFSGEIVAGISLLSDSIMRLRPSSKEWDSDDQSSSSGSRDDAEQEVRGHVDLYLPACSLYVLSGMSRYSYTHELLPSGTAFNFSSHEGGDTSAMNGSVEVLRGRRLSVIFRDANTSNST